VNDTTTESPPASTVAATLRAELARVGVSGRALAKQLGVHPAWMQRRLSGGVALSVTDLCRVADALDIPVADLMPTRRTP
jgi:transcriptional regulator with XRE-family HTH domain